MDTNNNKDGGHVGCVLV